MRSSDEPDQTTPVQQLYLHIYIGAMVLIRDFFAAFGAAYPEPAIAEATMAVRFTGLLSTWTVVHAARMAPVITEQVVPLLAARIAEELPGYEDRHRGEVERELRSYVDVLLADLEEGGTTSQHVIELADHLAGVVGAHQDEGFTTYARDAIADMLTTSIAFADLVAAVVEELDLGRE